MLPQPTITRNIRLRCRKDLVFSRVVVGDRVTWIAKDPLTLANHHLTVEEYFLLNQARTDASLAEVCARFEQEFAPQRMTEETLWSFYTRAYENGLVYSTASGQGGQLASKDHRQQLKRWSLAWTQILAMRFRGIDPNAFLTALHQNVRWLFTTWALAAVTVVFSYAAWIVVGNLDAFVSRLPELAALADPRNLLWLMLTLAVVKVLHELGHALACKHFGGEVHELGLMLLAFTPCLYCDVSDAWRLSNRWHRIAISAAGVFVELFLAALATIVWWHSQPGIINLLAFNTMVVCTISTLLINGNPLLRYDGYYVLSDLTETPNLWQRSRAALSDMLGSWLLGIKTKRDAMTKDRNPVWLAAYGLASKLYLVVVVVGIVWMLVNVLHPLRLHVLAYGIGFLVLGASLIGPAQSTARLLGNPLRRREIRTARATLVLLVLVAIAAAVLSSSPRYPVYAPLVLMPAEATRVYSTVAGRLEMAVPPGAPVASGQVVLKLNNPDIERELSKLRGEQELLELRLDQLSALRAFDPNASRQMPATRAALKAIETQLSDRRQDAAKLRVVAPRAGSVIAVPRVTLAKLSGHQLPQWTGAVQDPENQAAWIEPGTLACWVGDPMRVEAVLLVPDHEVEQLAVGQPAHLALDQLPGRVLAGEVREISHRIVSANSEEPGDALFQRLTVGLLSPDQTDSHVEVRVEVESVDCELFAGGRGEAKIFTAPMSLGSRAVRFLRQTFRLPM